MSRSLDEHVIASIDVLFQGARFLAGGDRHAAERLLEDTVLAAYHEAHQQGTPADERGLSVLMARTFLAQMSAGPAAPARAVPAPSPLDVTADGIFEAATRVPPRSRVALWLVLIRRWGYADACDALRVSESTLRELLREAQGFMSAFRGIPHPGIEGAGR